MKLSFLSGVLATSLIAGSVQAAELQITVDGLKNGRGDVWIMLYRGPGGFAIQSVESAISTIKLPAEKGSVSVTLHDLPDGDYAASVLHDQNANGDLDERNNTPVEGYGYTKNPRGNTAPGFSESSIFVKGKVETMIELIHH